MGCDGIGNCSSESYADVKGVWHDYDGALFLSVCEKCHRFVKRDKKVYVNQPEKPNATCKKCGRTTMHFEGYI